MKNLENIPRVNECTRRWSFARMENADALSSVRQFMRGWWSRVNLLTRLEVAYVLRESMRSWIHARSSRIWDTDLPDETKGFAAFAAWARHNLTDYECLLECGVDTALAHFLCMIELKSDGVLPTRG